VEAIRDNPRFRRVRVPESMVSYVSGALKKTRTGQVNSMRNARGGAKDDSSKNKKQHQKPSSAITSQKVHKKTTPSRKLTLADRNELELATRKGYLTLDGRDGHGSLASLCSSQSLKASRIAVAHRKWCDEQMKPNIVLYKASGRSSREVLDHLVVDLSPLRDQVSRRWTDEILRAAEAAGMNLHAAEDAEEYATDQNIEAATITKGAHANVSVGGRPESIYRLPFISLGFFVGERSNAKAMAKELVVLWDLRKVEDICDDEDEDSSSSMPHEHSKRDGYKNHHGKNGKKTIHNAQDRRRAQRRQIRRDDWGRSLGKS
jgi:hypothetical protein